MLVAATVAANEVVVLTQAESATGELGQLGLSTVLFTDVPELTAQTSLWGEQITGFSLVERGDSPLYISTQIRTTPFIDAKGGRFNYVTAVLPTPCPETRPELLDPPPSWDMRLACALQGTSGHGLLFLANQADDDQLHGRIVLRPAVNGDAAKPLEWTLPAHALQAIPYGQNRFLAVGKTENTTTLVLGDLTTRTLKTIVLEDTATGLLEPQPKVLWALPEWTSAVVALSGYPLHINSTEVETRLFQINLAENDIKASNIRFFGEAASATGPSSPYSTKRWLPTHSVNQATAYLYQIQFTEPDETGHPPLILQAQHTFANTTQQILFAAQSVRPKAAVAVDNRLYLCEGGTDTLFTTFTNPISALAWQGEDVIAGEANVLHRYAAGKMNQHTSIAMQTGHIQHIIPQANALEREHDAGAAPCPPRLHVPPDLFFQGDPTGRDARFLPIHIRNSTELLPWRIRYDKASLPWLHLWPETGSGEQYVPVNIDVALAASEAPRSTTLQIDLLHADGQSVQDTAAVRVHLLPSTGTDKQVLWIWGNRADTAFPGNPSLVPIMQVLSDLDTPYTHIHAQGPVREPLSHYNMVVIEAEALALGAITRRALQEYIAQGGAVLLVGRHLAESDSRSIAQWLAPMNIYAHTEQRVSGTFTRAVAHPLTRHWRDFTVDEGCLIRGGSDQILVPVDEDTPEAGVFAAASYGYGRVIVLASPDPLVQAAEDAEAPHSLITDIFDWLASARQDIRDMDQDGLLDSIEDSNGNGVADAQETDFRRADTDGDGLWDSQEDLNRNGLVDDGETNPRNIDSDGDGIWDGADVTPCPLAGIPIITAVEPHEGPAEGGTWIKLHGRHLNPRCRFKFGDRYAPYVRFIDDTLAEMQVPPFRIKSGGTVSITLHSNALAQPSMLANGFTYTPGSVVRINLVQREVNTTPGQHQTGKIHLAFDTPVPLAKLNATLEAVPGAGFSWGEYTLEPTALQTVQTQMRQDTDGRLHIMLAGFRGQSLPVKGGLTLEWRQALDEEHVPCRQITVHRALALSSQGMSLDVFAEPLFMMEQDENHTESQTDS